MKRFLLLLFIVFCGVSVFYAQTSSPEGEKCFQTALKLYYAKNYTEAITWYTKADKLYQGKSPGTLHNMALCYEKMGNYTEAAKYYTKAVDMGYAPSMTNLGLLYKSGYGVAQDIKKAAELHAEGAKKGNIMAMFHIGNAYLHGTGVKKDYDAAALYYRAAANKGHNLSQNQLGICYEKGYGVIRDFNEATYWYKKSAEQDCQVAKDNLARLKSLITNVDHPSQHAHLDIDWINATAPQLMKIADDDNLPIFTRMEIYKLAGERDPDYLLESYRKTAAACDKSYQYKHACNAYKAILKIDPDDDEAKRKLKMAKKGLSGQRALTASIVFDVLGSELGNISQVVANTMSDINNGLSNENSGSGGGSSGGSASGGGSSSAKSGSSSGKICKQCGGSGKCFGNGGKYHCQGRTTCQFCSGSKVNYVAGTPVVCEACKGTGKCKFCKGTGLCQHCHGTGRR